MNSDPQTMTFDGGAVKAVDPDSGKFEGYLVLYGNAGETDASPQRDYFTDKTDFGPATKSTVLYHHGLVAPLSNRSLAVGSLKSDAAGIWLEGQLALRDEYEQKIWTMIKAGKLGLSSGTASHLIRRQVQANGANKVLSWPLGLDASLTPAPAEPRSYAVALKALLPPEVKGLYLGESAEPAALMAAHGSLADRLKSSVWDHLGDENSDPDDRLVYKSMLKKGPGKKAGAEDAGAIKSTLEDTRLHQEIEALLARSIGFDFFPVS
jgi:hypothetical protein